MKVVLLNAPPSAGKDAFARFLFGADEPRENPLPGYDLHFERFSRPHKEAFAAMTGAKIDRFYNVEGYEDRKNEIIPWLGVSYRQWQIDFSEKYMKPLYGKDIFTRMFYARAKQIEQNAVLASNRDRSRKGSIFILADCGFDVELQSLIDYGLAPTDILLARIYRNGCTYAGDSRSYIYNKNVLSLDIENNKTLDAYGNDVLEAIRFWLTGTLNMTFHYEDFNKEGDNADLERRIQNHKG